MGYDSFTVDWYEVFMAWGLDLAELKQLAINSLKYSSMTEEDKRVRYKFIFTNVLKNFT